MGKKEVRSQGFSSCEMLEVDKFIFNLWIAARESKDLRYQKYFEKFLLTINHAAKFRSNSTNRQKLEAKVGRAVLDHILELSKSKDTAVEEEEE